MRCLKLLVLSVFLIQLILAEYAPDYPPLVPSSDPIAGSECIQHYLFTLEHQCEQIPTTPHQQRFVLRHCHNHLGRGLFVFNIAESGGLGQQDVFRVRIAGPELFVLPLVYCTQLTAYAPYGLELPGQYFVEVMHLMEAFTFEDEHRPPFREVLSVAEVEITVKEVHNAGACKPGECKFCSAADITSENFGGRWLASDVRKDGLDKACLPGFRGDMDTYNHKEPKSVCPAATFFSKNVDLNRLAWQPYNCTLRPVEDYDVEKCTEGRRICFIGDSHSRTAQNVLIQALNNTRPEDVGHYLHHNVLSVPYKVWYLWSVFGLLDDDVDLTTPTAEEIRAKIYPGLQEFGDAVNVTTILNNGCTDLVLGFGQWLIAYHAERIFGQPVSGGRYAEVLRNAATWLKALQRRGINVYWSTMHPVPYLPTYFRLPWLDDRVYWTTADYRSDPQVLLYNRISKAIMRQEGIKVLDYYAISAAVNELTYDDSHFIGSVGYALNQLIVTAMCEGNLTDRRMDVHVGR